MTKVSVPLNFLGSGVVLFPQYVTLRVLSWFTWMVSRPTTSVAVVPSGRRTFAMLKVSAGLILSMEDGFFPITQKIYSLVGRIDPNAPSIACALGVLGMLLLGACLWIASKLLGKRLGQLFRAG